MEILSKELKDFLNKTTTKLIVTIVLLLIILIILFAVENKTYTPLKDKYADKIDSLKIELNNNTHKIDSIERQLKSNKIDVIQVEKSRKDYEKNYKKSKDENSLQINDYINIYDDSTKLSTFSKLIE